MLRRGIIERNPSICAFCQLRISLRRTRYPSQRFLSSTRSLRDNGPGIPGPPASTSGGSVGGGGRGSGWGKPLFASSPAVARPNEPTPGAPASRPPAVELLPHEIEARRRLAESKAENARHERVQAAAGPKPGQGFRHSWNPQKQQEIKEFVTSEERDARGTTSTTPRPRFKQTSNSGWESNKSFREKPAAPTGVGWDPTLFTNRPPLTGTGWGTSPTPNRSPNSKSNFIERGQAPFSGERRPPRVLPHQTVGGESPRMAKPPKQKLPTENYNPVRRVTQPKAFSRSLKPNDMQTDVPTRPNTSQSGSMFDAICAELSSKLTSDPAQNQNREFPQKNAEPRSPSPITDSSWSSLTRKQQPASSNSAGFWNQFKEVTTESPKAPTSRKPIVSSTASRGAQQPPDADWGKEFDTPQLRRKIEARSATITRPEVSHGGRSARAKDFRETTRRRPRNSESLDIDEITPTVPAIPTVEYDYEDRRNRRREPGRSSRFEIEDLGTSRTQKKRGGRSSRYEHEEDEDDGMDDVYEQYIDKRRRKAERKAQREAERTEPQKITLPELISISNLAAALKVEKVSFLDQLAELGFEGISLDSIMAGETAALVAQEYGFEPTVETGDEHDIKVRPPPEDPSILPPRPPVVTIMGHVDHGKTTLLDYLRKSSVAAGEHGGITQHIGAFSVNMSSGKQITFLDTPGHAAFLSMRQRGANVTDIVVLVVAADDSVKPQTLEAIKHARQSKVPIIVAISKVDKEGAQIDRVKADLASNGVEIEDYGGDVQVVCVSGKTGDGMDDLEENILTLSEILDMRAEIDGPAEGWILESSLKPIGKVATILVKRGTLRPGDFIVAGTTFAKIRHLRNEAGQEITEAPPGTPVEILGWRDLPAAGDEVVQGEDERHVRMAAEYRESIREREQDAAAHEKISEQRRLVSEQRKAEKAAETGKHKRVDGSWGTQEVLSDMENGTKMVNFVIKGDVHGSVEACTAAILEIGSNEVRPRVLLASPGAITESDVDHAATSNSAIVNFNLPVSGLMKRQAELAGVKILDHTVIYHLTDDVKDHLGSFLGVDVSYKVLGEAEIQEIFPINIKGRKYKNIAGCRIRNGSVERNHLLRVMRGGEKIFEGKLESFKHLRKDIDEARKGTECGIGFEEFQDLHVGDQIQAIEEVQTKRTL